MTTGYSVAAPKTGSNITVGFPLYAGFDSLDVIAPYQIFSFLPNCTALLVAETCSPITSGEGVTVIPPTDFASCPQLDVIYVPGAGGVRSVLDDAPLDSNVYLQFLLAQAASAKLVVGVCTGAILLAAAGLLDGYLATTHWAFQGVLRMFPAVQLAPNYPRFIIDGNRVTGGGISSGLDEGYAIAALLYDNFQAEKVQLSMQYNPQPPFNDGDPSVAQPRVLAEVSQDMRQTIDLTMESVRNFQKGQ